jgi:hypothetical protein
VIGKDRRSFGVDENFPSEGLDRSAMEDVIDSTGIVAKEGDLSRGWLLQAHSNNRCGRGTSEGAKSNGSNPSRRAF